MPHMSVKNDNHIFGVIRLNARLLGTSLYAS